MSILFRCLSYFVFCCSLLNYVIGDEKNSGLTPHLTKKTVSINEARRIIMQLSKPLADISQAISDSVYEIDQHMKKLKRENQSLEELKTNMFIPVVDVRQELFNEPRTVCTSLKCAEVFTVCKYFFLRNRCR